MSIRTSPRTAPQPSPPTAPPTGFRHRNLPLLLLRARECVMAGFRPVLNAHGVTEQQWRIVRALLESGPLEPHQIGRRCGMSSPSLAGVLARMDDMGLVTRERLTHDQRRVRVQLTPQAEALAAELAPDIEAQYAALEARVGAPRIEALYARLDELIGLLEDASDAPDPAQAADPDDSADPAAGPRRRSTRKTPEPPAAPAPPGGRRPRPRGG